MFNGSLEAVEQFFTMPHRTKLMLQSIVLAGDAFPANSDKWALFFMNWLLVACANRWPLDSSRTSTSPRIGFV